MTLLEEREREKKQQPRKSLLINCIESFTVMAHEIKYCCRSSNFTINRRRKSFCSDSD